MNIKAYALYEQPAPVQPATDTRSWLQANETLRAELAVASATPQGWELLCPLAFAATWNGGPNPEDIEIRLAAEAALDDDTADTAFVQSAHGGGVLTFYPGYQWQTEDGYLLWVRGPINAAKAGLAPLESLVDASLLPCTVVSHWQFTHPNQTVYFAAGEPFATILPYAKRVEETMTVEVVKLAPNGDGDLDAYEQAFQQLIDSAAVQNLFQRMGAAPVATADKAARIANPSRAMLSRVEFDPARRDATECAATPPIPNVFHFIFLEPDQSDIPFSLVHYLAIKSAFVVNQPDAINLYYRNESTGEWWEKAKSYANLVRVEPPTQIFGQPLCHYAHQADVLRLQILLEQGGIYLDMDVICTKPFTPLLHHPFVLGQEGGTHSLCNGVILAQKNASFIQKWLAGFDPKTSLWQGFRSKGRDHYWAEYSVLYPAHLAKLLPELIHIESADKFHWPLWHDEHLQWLFEGNSDSFEISYCHHLWETLSWEKYLRHLTVEQITQVDTNFNRIARRFL